MPSFGFKIVDRLESGMECILDHALSRRAPVEVGLFFAETRARDLLRDRLSDRTLPVAVHLDHRRLSLLGITRKEAQLREQLAVAAELGASLAVTHLGAYPMTARPRLWPRLWEQLAAELRFVQRTAADYGLRIHLENTFHPLPFYRRLLHALRASHGVQTDFCFDLGHANVWSCESLQDWVELLASEAAAGMRLHFHLHANQGLVDQHLPFAEAIRLDADEEEDDDFRRGLDWRGVLRLIDERFPEPIKIFEVPPEAAIENYEWVLAESAAWAPPAK